MTSIDIVRAWKDEEYRASLSAAELAALPDNPVGMIELDDAALEAAAGGSSYVPTYNGCPTNDTWYCCLDTSEYCGPSALIGEVYVCW